MATEHRIQKNPKVTVLMSVYNGEKYLKEAVDSILSQTFTDFEFLIIDDASTDRTPEILRSYRDPRIRIITNEENLGLTKSLNRGLALVMGKYIARMDADDISYPQRIEEQVKYLEEFQNVGLVGSSFEIIDESGNIVSRNVYKNYTSENIYYKLIFNNCIAHSSVMYRRDLVIKIGGYNERLTRTQDYDLWSKISKRSRIEIIDEVLLKWRDSQSNISNKCKTEQDLIAKNIFEENIRSIKQSYIIDLEKIICFHDEGFPERRPITIKKENINELKKVHKLLILNCPPYIDRSKLSSYCNKKIIDYNVRRLVPNSYISNLISQMLNILRFKLKVGNYD